MTLDYLWKLPPMQRRVLLGAGALVLVAVFIGIRGVTRHEAGKAVDQGIDQLIARLPPGTAIRHGMVDYNPLTNAATVHSVVMTRDGATLVTADAVTVSGADGQAVQDVFDPAAYPGGKPAWTERRLLVADASAQGVHLTIAGPQPGDLAIRRVTLHRLSGRPFMLPPTPENHARPDFLADAALALAADSLQANDAVLTAPSVAQSDSSASVPASEPAKNAFAIGSATISDYDGGKLGSLAIKAVSLDSDGKPRGTAVHMSLAALDLKTADLRPVAQSVRSNGQADRGALGRTTYEAFNLSDMALDVASGPHVALQDFHASHESSGSGLAAGRGSLHGLTLALGHTAVPPAAAASLAAFGANAITLDIDATSKVQPGGGAADITEDVVVRDLGILHVKGIFSGYDAALSTPAQPMAGILATTLENASIVFEDRSLTNRLLAVAAAQMHSTPEILRAQMAMPVLTLGLMLPNQPDAADQVTNFLNHPGTLTVTMNPPQKTTFAQIAQAPVPTRLQMLGLHVTSK